MDVRRVTQQDIFLKCIGDGSSKVFRKGGAYIPACNIISQTTCFFTLRLLCTEQSGECSI